MKEKIKNLGKIRLKISHGQILLVSVLLLILLIAFLIRMLPMRWGFHLSEFDPYVHYRSAKYVVDNGFIAWFSWHDTERWYPMGIDTYRAIFPGVAFTGAFLYKIIEALALPISLYNFVVILPPIMAALASLVMYFWGKDTHGKATGLFSALFLALNASYIGRTSLGWFDDESVGIFAIILFSLLFLRSIDKDRSWNSTLRYSVASGLTLGYLFISWGAAYFPLGLIASFAVLMVILKRYSLRLLFSYGCTLGLSLFIAVNIPKLSTEFLFRFPVIFATLIFLLLCLYEILSQVKTWRWRMIYVASFVTLIFLVLALMGKVEMTGGKVLAVLNPFTRSASPLVESVQEHRPPAWGSFYYDYGIGIFFIVIGLYFTVRNLTDRNVFLILYALTSLYFSSSMVRLLVILAPSLSLLWAIGLVGTLKPFFVVMSGNPKRKLSSKKKYVLNYVGKEFSAITIILVFSLISLSFILPINATRDSPRVIDQAYSPVTIMASSVPLRMNEPILEWYDSLMWMRYELSDDAIVVCWWDYGYWITVMGDKTTLSDNGTSNATQIANIGRMFMSKEAEAVQILERYNHNGRRSEYVLVFATFDTRGYDAGYGDEGKWRWMSKIAGLDDNSFGNFSLGYNWHDDNNNQKTEAEELKVCAKGQNTTLFKLISYAKHDKISSVTPPKLECFEKVYLSSGKSYGGIHIVVAIYKVKYEVPP